MRDFTARQREIIEHALRLIARHLSLFQRKPALVTLLLPEEIRRGIDPEQPALMISGSLRLIVKRRRLAGYPDGLESRGSRFWRTLSAMIQGPKSPAGDISGR